MLDTLRNLTARRTRKYTMLGSSSDSADLFATLHGKIRARVKQYIDTNEGNWKETAKDFLNSKLPPLLAERSVLKLIAQTRTFCQSITSKLKSIPGTGMLGYISGHQGSPLQQDLLALCNEFEKKLIDPSYTGETVDSAESFDTSSEMPREDEAALVRATKQLSLGVTTTTSTSTSLVLEKSNEPEDKGASSPPAVAPAPALAIDKDAKIETSDNEEDIEDERIDDDTSACLAMSMETDTSESSPPQSRAKTPPRLGPIDKFTLEIFGGEEGQARLIKSLKAELEAERKKTQKLEDNNQALAAIIGAQTQEIDSMRRRHNARTDASASTSTSSGSFSTESRADSRKISKSSPFK